MSNRSYFFAGLFATACLCTGTCLAQCAPEQVALNGITLGSGYSIGLNTSGNRTDWLATEAAADFVMRYPAGQAWGSVFITDGMAVATNRPGIDLSTCKTLIIELSGDPGSTVAVGIKDSNQPDDGTEAKRTLTLSGDFQTYTIPLSSFIGVNLSKVYVLCELVFGDSQQSQTAQTVRLRSIKFSSASALSTKILPQLAYGGGWYSAVYFTNTSAAAVSFRADFFADDGSSLTLPSVGSSNKVFNLGPRSTGIIEAPNTGPLTQGYVSAALPPEVAGYGVFRWSNAGSPDQEAVVPLSGNTATVSTLVWDDTKYTTAIAILNPASVAAAVSVTVRNESGQIIGTAALSLAPGNKKTFLLRDLPGLGAVSGSRGSVDFVATTGAASVLGLRANGAAITSIPATDR